MLDNLIVVLGGSKSGKSSFAMNLAKKGNQVTYIVTARLGDEEMKKRIEKHKEARPNGWRTFEVDKDIVDTMKKIKQKGGLIIIDCWSLYVANLLDGLGFENPEEEIIETNIYEKVEQQVIEETNALIEEVKKLECKVVIVSNEVGLGLVPPYPSGRCFRDLLGLSHQILAREASKVYFILAGIPLELPRL
jgi:adenosylcobinamide kinase/adenosylcobinamide-phosphate guanylyltransferase